MKIGLLLPSLLMAERFENRIFAQKELFFWLADGLVEKGHEVFAYCASGNHTKAQLISGNQSLEQNNYRSIKDKNVPANETLSYIRSQHEYEIELLQKAVVDASQKKLDVLHIYSSSWASSFLKLIPIPYLYTIHDPVPPADSLEYLRFQESLRGCFSMISHSQERLYQQAFGLKSYVVHHGLNLDNFHTAQDTKQSYAAFIGRYMPEKGIPDAIQVALRLQIKLKLATSPNYQETDYYKQEIKPHLQSGVITEAEFLTGVKKDVFLQQTKVFLLPIHWEEPFGMVLAESMACGTPVVAYARGATPEIIKDGETGFLVNPSEDDIRGNFIIKKTGIEGLCEAVERIYHMSESEYALMRKECRAHIVKHFSVDRMVENYEKVYREVSRK